MTDDPYAKHLAFLDYQRARPEPVRAPVIEIVPDATVTGVGDVVKSPQGVSIQDSGVYHADDALCGLSLHRASNIPEDNIAPDPLPSERRARGDVVPGRHLFGGIIGPHFGHYLVESLGRLWAVDHLKGEFDSLVFIRTHGPKRTPFADFGQDVLAALGLDLPVHTVVRPTRFAELVVPSQLFGFHLRAGHPLFHAFVHRRLRAISGAGEGARRLYVSRRQYGDTPGEEALETLLAGHGYRIIQPESLSFAEQIAAYNAADTVLLAEGSAVHVLAMVARADQRVGVVQRRPGVFAGGMDHLRGFSGRAGVLIASQPVESVADRLAQNGFLAN
ncbi:DUF563 domain-containing protein [Acuticoccus sp. I52.16.1]|uniref:glycosyltransferase family 61 protein n=1 Tax=Acuticoccus sp. I52.16.1 TaxID=2928472 RepID=UPI001FD31D30|nr:glycosyltransferase 61 family protein [Acuticoccus sp. I52.16.1]UOM36849.1 glycosyltransferase family 61 protein [Acuticoccus sp. I52.16.1]